MNQNNKNYIEGKWGIGIANKWMLWYFPLFIMVVFTPAFFGYEQLCDSLAIAMIFFLLVLDLYLRVSKSQKNLLDSLTFPDEGYVLHIVIFPLPVWMVCSIVLILVFV